MLISHYLQSTSLREVIDTLRRFNGAARIIAGGTGLVIDLKTQRRKVDVLIDISPTEVLPPMNFGPTQHR